MPQSHKRPVDGHIGTRLAEARKARGISQAWLAKRIGVSVGTVQAYEHGRARIAVDRLKALADALRCEPANLLNLLLFALLHGGHDGRCVKADRLGQIDELDHIEAPIAALETGNPGLRPLQLLGELDLADIGALALGNYQLDEAFMAFAMNGFHLF
jgi:transcriptional regulator with XRE-family HTH domain